MAVFDRKDFMRVKLPEPVYFVESAEDDSVLVGINVTIEYRQDNHHGAFTIYWFDTTHERAMMASEIRVKYGYFAFRRLKREGGGIYIFTPMNLQIYDNKVKQRLTAGRDFTNNEDLIKAFLATTEDAL